MRTRHASVEARTHAARGTSSAETHGRSLGRFFVLVRILAEMHCTSRYPSRGLHLAMRCLFPCVIAPANLPANLLGFAWHELPAYFREPAKIV